jgi:hypothetical protein
MSDLDHTTVDAEDGSDPFPEISRKRRRGVRVTTAAAIALGLAIGGGAIAGASSSSGSRPSTRPPAGSSAPASASGRHGPMGVKPTAVGTVTSVTGETFVLSTGSGTTVTVDVSSSTTYRDWGTASASLADVKVGQHVAVVGKESDGTVTATSVMVGTPPTSGKGGPGGGNSGPPGGSMGTASRPAAGKGAKGTKLPAGTSSTSG